MAHSLNRSGHPRKGFRGILSDNLVESLKEAKMAARWLYVAAVLFFACGVALFFAVDGWTRWFYPLVGALSMAVLVLEARNRSK